jgi:hypothetical protein
MADNEQVVLALNLLEGGDMLLMAVARDKEIAVAICPSYDDPRAFGIILADMVEHIVSAYEEKDFDPQEVRDAVMDVLLTELAEPRRESKLVGLYLQPSLDE